MQQATVAKVSRPEGRPIRVMIVDDAVVVRGLVNRWLTDEGGFEVISTCRSAIDAISDLDRMEPDLIVLDIEMPDMDGLTALPFILRKCPGVAVIVSSSLGATQADLTLRCMALGAADFLPKPSSNREVTTSLQFRRELIERATVLGARVVQRRQGVLQARRKPMDGAVPPAIPRPSLVSNAGQMPLRPRKRPTVVAIGASTGGPNAVIEMLRAMPRVLERLPVVVVQHMPATFTAIFAEHVARQVGVPAGEANDGDLLLPGRVYIAPGGRHMKLAGNRGALRIALDNGPAVNFCKPSVDVLFFSAAEISGASVVACVLTGMGSDGCQGARAISDEGGAVFAQDEPSSVVWGMPGAVVRSGICQAQGTAPELGHIMTKFIFAEAP